MKKRVVVIGGGAAGMTAAIIAARGGADVTVLEHMDRVGKKLLSTGNGRCNFTNRNQKPEYYRCSQADFAWKVIRQFPFEETVNFFEEMGILPKERNGYFYPNSDQASSVLDVLRMELEREHVKVQTGCQVLRIEPEKEHGGLRTDCQIPRTEPEEEDAVLRTGCQVSRIEAEQEQIGLRTDCRELQSRNEGAGKRKRIFVRTDQGVILADAVVLAAGSKAAPSTGSDGSGYELARGLGHRILTPLPALVQLRCAEKDFRQLTGVRVDAKVDLYAELHAQEDDVSAKKEGGVSAAKPKNAERDVPADRTTGERWELLASDCGELQLTDYGISGIPVFQVSRYASISLFHNKRVKAVIDFFPRQSREETKEMIRRRAASMPDKTCEQWMCGLFHKKLSGVLLKRAGLSLTQRAGDVDENGWNALYRQMRCFTATVTAANSYEHAQVCCGGVDTSEVDPLTLQSKLVPGVYFAGEILDVDGICGGYNLQWAWSSGAVAGRNAARGI